MLIYAWMRRHERIVDVLVAVVLGVGCVGFGIFVGAGAAYVLLSLALVLPLAVRRRWPVPCAGAVVVAAFVQWVTVRDTVGALPADLAVPIVVHACAAYGPAWARRLVVGCGLVGAGLGGVSWPQLPVPVWAHLLVAGFLASSVVAAWAVGERARLREVERGQRERLAVLAERNRIAREMHDVVAHSLAVVIAQADGGRYASQAAETALTTIAECAREALAETRRVLGVLRNPQPGIEDLPGLVDRVRAGGLDVRLTLEAPPVEPGLGLVAYRIVQEGLTNVLRHAGPDARAEVSVRWVAGRLEIDVCDDGTEAPSTAGGYGVLGMRERAATYGGTVTLRPNPGGGRTLSARIPS